MITLIKLAREINNVSRLTGTFELKSGQIANVYFDKYQFESDPVLLYHICTALVHLVPEDAEVLCGLEMGGIPLATLLSFYTRLPCAFIRKQPKHYGTKKYAEGADLFGKKILLVEDIVTSGSSVIQAAEMLREDNIEVHDVICVIDREEGGRKNLANNNLKLTSLFTRSYLDIACITQNGITDF